MPAHDPLYTRGAVRFWRMERDGGSYRSVSGVLGGAFMEQGYEGAMVRLDMPYEVGKRSKGLLKLKDFLVRVEEGLGNWTGYAKTAVIRLADGREQSSGLRGSQEFTRQLLADWRHYSQVTVW